MVKLFNFWNMKIRILQTAKSLQAEAASAMPTLGSAQQWVHLSTVQALVERIEDTLKVTVSFFLCFCFLCFRVFISQ